MKGGEGRQKIWGGFRSSIQFIDGLTALLGPCYAAARCPGYEDRNENDGETTVDLIVPLFRLAYVFPG